MTDKTTIHRLAERGVSDRGVIESILDEGFVCHAAYVTEGRPVVLPTLFARDGDRLLLHGSNSMGLAKAVRSEGKPDAELPIATCDRGHPLTADNIQHVGVAGDRCKECRRRIARESARRRRAAR